MLYRKSIIDLTVEKCDMTYKQYIHSYSSMIHVYNLMQKYNFKVIILVKHRTSSYLSNNYNLHIYMNIIDLVAHFENQYRFLVQLFLELSVLSDMQLESKIENYRY